MSITARSQCTWWCWVLPDRTFLNPDNLAAIVSMHLMVLGASRHYTKKMAESVAIVSMHLMMLGASRPFPLRRSCTTSTRSQCT